MQRPLLTFCTGLTVLLMGISLGAERIPVPLNDYTRLGQVFKASSSFTGVAVTVPSWSDNEGGLTLTLWDSPERTKRLATQAYVGIEDNAQAELAVPKPLPPGTYYWEIDQRTGETRVGLYADVLDEDTEECVYFDGVPDHRKRFVFGVGPTAFRYTSVPEMLAAANSDREAPERQDALRQLAIQGTADTVPVLAELLRGEDAGLAHLARSAMESMPYPSVDDAFLAALADLSGPALVGVINSIAVRRTTAAVPALTALLSTGDPGVERAAAIALGSVGTVASGEALLQALPGASDILLPALYGGMLTCAQRLSAAGPSVAAQGFCDALLARLVPQAVREAALRGAIVSRGVEGVPLLLQVLRGDDPALVRVAIWVAHHDLPGGEVSQALAAGLPGLTEERRLLLIEALCRRADAVVLPALLLGVRPSESSAVRATTLRGLPSFGGTVAPTLAAAVGDADADVAKTAEHALAELPGPAANAVIVDLIAPPDGARRLAGIRLAGARGLAAARPGLLDAAGSSDAEVRVAALKVVADLATAADVAPLTDILVRAADAPSREAAERALAAACKTAPDATTQVPGLLAHLPNAAPPLHEALLRVVDGIGGAAARQAVLRATESPDADVRAGAYRLLGEWTAPEAFPDLLRLAADSPDATGKVLCLRACIRFVGDGNLPMEQRLGIARQVHPMIQRSDEKKQLLGMLSGLMAPGALDLAATYVAEPDVRGEAAVTVLAIAKGMAQGADAALTVPALEKVRAAQPDSEAAQEAEALLQAVGKK